MNFFGSDSQLHQRADKMRHNYFFLSGNKQVYLNQQKLTNLMSAQTDFLGRFTLIILTLYARKD